MIVIMIFLVKINSNNSINRNNSNGNSHSLNESSNKFILIINILNLTLHQPIWFEFASVLDFRLNLIDQMAHYCIYYFPPTIGWGGRRITICLVLIDCCMIEGWYCCAMLQLFHPIPIAPCVRKTPQSTFPSMYTDSIDGYFLLLLLLLLLLIDWLLRYCLILMFSSISSPVVLLAFRRFCWFCCEASWCRHDSVSHPPLPSCRWLNDGRMCGKWMDRESGTGGPTRTTAMTSNTHAVVGDAREGIWVQY